MMIFTPYEYILIDIANQYGLDKKTWNERITWTNTFLVLPDSEQNALIQKAKEPILMVKALIAMEDAKNSKPTGFIMGLDATSSGLQISACLIGCQITARNTNLINAGKRVSAYAIVTDELNIVTNSNYTEKVVKYPTMTTFYGSMEQPKDIFGDGTPELEAFYEVLQEELPGAVEVLKDIQDCWQADALYHEFTLPDGHVAHIKVMEAMTKKIEVDELNHSTFTHQSYLNQASEFGLSLAANIHHGIDGYIVREMTRRAHKQGFEMLSIHDSFWASPNHMQKVRQNYVDILCEIADMDLLGSILREITGGSGVYQKHTSNLSSYIKDAEYALS